MNLTQGIIELEYDSGYADARQLLFSRSTGISWKKCPDNQKCVEPIYLSCDELDFNGHCCLNCHGDNHSGDYDRSQGRMERQYVESRHGLIIFYCCCEHQGVENLLKVLDKYIERNK